MTVPFDSNDPFAQLEALNKERANQEKVTPAKSAPVGSTTTVPGKDETLEGGGTETPLDVPIVAKVEKKSGGRNVRISAYSTPDLHAFVQSYTLRPQTDGKTYPSLSEVADWLLERARTQLVDEGLPPMPAAKPKA